MAYRYADPTDRWKALTAVVLIHAGIGAVFVSGLNVRFVTQTVERLQTFDIELPKPPPPPPPPPPKEQPKEDRSEAGAPEKKPSPSPVVVPKPKIVTPTPNPIVASDVAGTGNARTAGAGGRGTGTGSGGTGTGTGSGDGRGFTPARLVRNLTRGDYRRITGGRPVSGSAALALRVNTSGQVDSCLLMRPSGDAIVDGGLCGLARERLRFSPARDAGGRPVPYSTNYIAMWRQR